MDKITVVCHKDHDKGYEDYVGKCLLCEVERVRLDEREACAKVGENMERSAIWITKAEAAKAIRARGEK